MKFRILIKPQQSREQELSLAASLRRNLWSDTPIEIKPEDPNFQTKRMDNGQAYFEFVTPYAEEVHRIIREYNYGNFVDIQAVEIPQEQL